MTLVVVAVASCLVGVLAGWFWAGRRGLVGAEPSHDTASTGQPGLAEVLDGHPTGIVVAGPAGAVWFANASARRLDGTHSGLLLDAAIERHLAAGRSGSGEVETVEFYGPPRQFFVITSHPLPDGGSVVFVDDVSERRRIDQMRTDFVSNISHELKTPIGAMSVLAETLVDENDPETIRRVVNRMLAEADRAADTIEDLMELSRIESGGDRIVDDVRVSDIVKGALDRVSELAAQRSISVTTLEAVDRSTQGSDRLVIRGDRRQLVSALGNLVENAVKYSDPGSSVQVRSRQVDGNVEISVTDQGSGIPARDLNRIFERFYRVDRARSRATGGTGLGLAIVRHVASNHGGVVDVTSVEGEGSTFVLRLPSDQQHRPRERSGGTEHPASQPDSPAPGMSHDQGVA